MTSSLKKIAAVKKKHERAWLNLEGVVGIGIGETSQKQPGIIISVKALTDTIRGSIPESVEGVIIEVRETGEIRAL
jgi:hypothetical protein